MEPSTGLLEQIYQDWRSKGWHLADLNAFRMEGEEENDDEEEDDDEGEKTKPKTFTQAQVNKFLATEKKAWKKSVQADLLKELGVESVDEAKAITQAHKEAEDKNKSEAERLANKAKNESSAAEKDKAEAAEDRLMAKIERSLLRNGLDDEEVEEIAVLVRRRVDLDADADGITEAVEAQKKRMPKLFTSTSEDDGEGKDGEKTVRKGPKSVGDTKPPKKPTPADARGQARSLLESRHPKKFANKS